MVNYILFLGVFMKLSQIENGLSYAGNLRCRNYKERACAPDVDRTKHCCPFREEHKILKQALKTASRILAADVYEKSTANNI